jgi:hypothetical protein
MNWVTAEKGMVDRIASSWLIKNFVDKDAQFIFVSQDKVRKTAEDLSATPFDTDNVELTHFQERGNEYVTFDAILRKYNIRDQALHELAKIVRGADARLSGITDSAPEARGLEAAAIGYRIMASEDDHENMLLQFPLYDALYKYCQWLVEEGREVEHSIH